MSLLVRWDPKEGNLDLVRGEDGALLCDPTLRSEILLQLLSHRLAPEDAALPGVAAGATPPPGARRGHWGDILTPGRRVGSLLWLLWRQKELPVTAARAKAYCEQALQYLLDAGRVTALAVETGFPRPGCLAIQVAWQASGEDWLRLKLWDDQGRLEVGYGA